MVTIEELKSRLEKLPQLKAESDLGGHFACYKLQMIRFYADLSAVYQDSIYASKVNSNSDYKRVLTEIKKAVLEAKNLYQEIENEAKNISKTANENKVIRISEFSKSARKKCDDIWNQERQKDLGKWVKISDVVKKMVKKGKQEFKNNVREFSQAVDAMSLQSIPKNNEEVSRLQDLKNELLSRVATLGLEGPFGKFLENSVDRGVSAKELLKDEIRSKLEEYDLLDSFRVRLD